VRGLRPGLQQLVAAVDLVLQGQQAFTNGRLEIVEPQRVQGRDGTCAGPLVRFDVSPLQRLLGQGQAMHVVTDFTGLF
jgi:hypothetical protein